MKFLFYLIQFTCGLPQNILGFLLSRKYKKSQKFFGANIYYHDQNWGGVSLGMFIIMSGINGKEWTESVKVHEYGHSLQSLILGPFYLLFIGLPSMIWCKSKRFINYRAQNNISYYSFYTEKWANYLGSKVTKMQVRV